LFPPTACLRIRSMVVVPDRWAPGREEDNTDISGGDYAPPVFTSTPLFFIPSSTVCTISPPSNSCAHSPLPTSLMPPSPWHMPGGRPKAPQRSAAVVPYRRSNRGASAPSAGLRSSQARCGNHLAVVNIAPPNRAPPPRWQSRQNLVAPVLGVARSGHSGCWCRWI
jgi:hypothetical protein